jgi:hypothetical protein
MVGKPSNRIRAFEFDSIRTSVTRRIWPSVRWREKRHALIQSAHSPTINSGHSIAGELRRPSRRVVGVQLEIRL